MHGKTLDFFQIYYKKEQRNQLYDFTIPYLNKDLTPYFENSIIKTLVPNSTADFISISSWKLRRKRSSMPSKHVLKESALKLSKELILSSDFDVAILTPRIEGHKTLFMSEHWHGQAWIDSFSVLSEFLEKQLNIKMPSELRYAIYENHFIAKGQIYRDYVSLCLIPVIDYMQTNNVFNLKSGYRKHKERLGDFDSVVDYENSTRSKDWPMSTFLLERLFSIWINNKNLSVVNL